MCYSWVPEESAEREIENRSNINMGRAQIKSRRKTVRTIYAHNLKVRMWRSQQHMENCVFHKLMCFSDTYSKNIIKLYALKYPFMYTQV